MAVRAGTVSAAVALPRVVRTHTAVTPADAVSAAAPRGIRIAAVSAMAEDGAIATEVTIGVAGSATTRRLMVMAILMPHTNAIRLVIMTAGAGGFLTPVAMLRPTDIENRGSDGA